MPDFLRLAKLTAKGKTVKEVWQHYAQTTPKAYSYPYFSTLFRVWLEENKLEESRSREPHTDRIADALSYVGKPNIPDYTADEDYAAELFWKDHIDPRAAIHSLYGHGCSVKVQRGELVTCDSGAERRFAKVVHGLSGLIL